MFLRSPRGTSSPSASRASTILSTGRDSPVSADSSTLRLALSTTRQSAGTASPASRTTTSPGTSSSERTSTIFPSRTTLEVLAAICWRASKASSALDSWTTPRTALTTTTNRMMTTSAMSDSPWAAPATALMTAAASNRMIMGSASWARKRFHSGSFLASSSLLGPYWPRRLATSASVRPASTSVERPPRRRFAGTVSNLFPPGFSAAARSVPDHNSPGGARAHQGCHGGGMTRRGRFYPASPLRRPPVADSTGPPATVPVLLSGNQKKSR